MRLKPCPFCGHPPVLGPPIIRDVLDKARGYVECVNVRCAARPCVGDGVEVIDDRGTRAYQRAAARRWNRRAS